MAFETYQARAGSQVALAVAVAGAPSPFTIEVRFLGGLTATQKNAFKLAADRWSRVIVGDLPSVTIDGETIDDVLILAEGANIDGPGKILGQAGPTHLRPASAGAFAFIPAKGSMTFDSADLADMEQQGTLNDVIAHEMGHVLGIGTIWPRKGLLNGAGSANPTFVGARAMEEFGKLLNTNPTPVPVENRGGVGTQDSHWRETVFHNELMSGFIAAPGNPLSRVTVGSLEDLGYAVDLNAAEPYALPDVQALAMAGELAAVEDALDAGLMLPNIPTVLPAESLQH
jgi:hypothetical protein